MNILCKTHRIIGFQKTQKRLILVLLCALLITLLCTCTNTDSKIQNANELLINNQYQQFITYVNENRLNEKTITELLKNKVLSFSVETSDEFCGFSDDDWNNIKELYNLILVLNYNNKGYANYLEKLLQMEEKYSQYIGDILFMNSVEYQVFKTFSGDPSGSYIFESTIFRNIEFPKYNQQSTYYESFLTNINLYCDGVDKAEWARKYGNERDLETYKDIIIASLYNRAADEMNMIVKKYELLADIKVLSEIIIE